MYLRYHLVCVMQEEKSKSQKKREAQALQMLGEQLTQLSKQQLAKIPLPEELMQVILQEKSIKTHGAKKRYRQFIGRMMRDIDDVKPIQAAYENMIKSTNIDTQKFHLVELWRKRLMSGDEQTLTE